MELVIDLQSIRLEVSDEEYKLLSECHIPNAVNKRVLEILKNKVKTGEGIIENWEEME